MLLRLKREMMSIAVSSFISIPSFLSSATISAILMLPTLAGTPTKSDGSLVRGLSLSHAFKVFFIVIMFIGLYIILYVFFYKRGIAPPLGVFISLLHNE